MIFISIHSKDLSFCCLLWWESTHKRVWWKHSRIHKLHSQSSRYSSRHTPRHVHGHRHTHWHPHSSHTHWCQWHSHPWHHVWVPRRWVKLVLLRLARLDCLQVVVTLSLVLVNVDIRFLQDKVAVDVGDLGPAGESFIHLLTSLNNYYWLENVMVPLCIDPSVFEGDLLNPEFVIFPNCENSSMNLLISTSPRILLMKIVESLAASLCSLSFFVKKYSSFMSPPNSFTLKFCLAFSRSLEFS